MTSSSHLASSALFYLGAAALAEIPLSIEGLAITAAGSLLPDIDTPTSSIGRPFFPVASWIDQKVGHRTLTHSFLGITLFGVLVLCTAWTVSGWRADHSPLPHYGWLLILGYASHVLVDTLNKTGVELFWPSKLRCVFFYSHNWRITAAGKGDYWFMTACLLLNLAAYPLARDGFTLSLHRAFGDIYSVSMDFKQYGDKNRIWVDLEGVGAISNQKVKGRFEILAALDNGAVLIERDGTKQIVSRTKPFQIFPDKVKIAIGKPQHIRTQEIDMAGRTLGEIPRFAETSRVLLYGYLTPARFSPVRIYENRYDSISLRLDKLKLEHADYADIERQGLEHVLIREGILILKIHQSAAGEMKTDTVSTGAPIRHVELRFEATDEVLLREGDLIRFGQTIGRKSISLQAERLEQDHHWDIERIQEDLTETEAQLSETRQDLLAAEDETKALEIELLRLQAQRLFAKEYLRLQDALASAGGRRETAARKIASLEQKERRFKEQIRIRSEQLLQRIDLLHKQAEIPASFSGEIIRIDEKPENAVVVYSVLYRGPSEPDVEIRKDATPGHQMVPEESMSQ